MWKRRERRRGKKGKVMRGEGREEGERGDRLW